MDNVTEVFELNQDGFERALAAVREGRVIVLPTDTVYGVGADPFSGEAVFSLLKTKRRGQEMPPPVLIAEPSMLRSLASRVPETAKAVAERFWPGPLTIIVDAQPEAGLRLGETHGTVALRVPDHEGTRALLRVTGPLAVSSANLSGEPPATSCLAAQEQLEDAVAVYLDAGPSSGQVPSTIIDFSGDKPGLVLRVGAVSLEQLKEVSADITLLSEDNFSSEVEAVPMVAEKDTAEANDISIAAERADQHIAESHQSDSAELKIDVAATSEDEGRAPDA